MTTEANKALVKRFIEEVVNGDNQEYFTDYFMPGSILAGGSRDKIRP